MRRSKQKLNNPLAVIGFILATLILIWALRLDHLRAYWQDRVYSITAVIQDVVPDKTISQEGVEIAIREVASDRNIYFKQKESATKIVIDQEGKIITLTNERDDLQNGRKLDAVEIQNLKNEREMWRKIAKEARHEVDRMAAEVEIKICDETLNSAE